MPELNRGVSDIDLAPSGVEAAKRAFSFLKSKLKTTSGRAAAQATPLDLIQTIECEIVPRLMLVHKSQDIEDSTPMARRTLAPADHDEFLRRLRFDTPSATLLHVEDLMARGVPRQTILLDLLAHAARTLGELWDSDVVNFSEVTVGLCQIHEIVRTLSARYEPQKPHAAGPEPSILFATLCGDQHILGLVIVADLFRRGGWRVWCEGGADRRDLQAILRRRNIDALGLSRSADAPKAELADEVAALKAASLNRDLKVFVGGAVFAADARLAAEIGADAMLDHAPTAPDMVRNFLAEARIDC